jgi:hypothetical protein
MRRRHPDIDDRQLRLCRAHQRQELSPVPRLADNIEPRAVEQASEAFAKQDVIVGQDDPWSATTRWRYTSCQ